MKKHRAPGRPPLPRGKRRDDTVKFRATRDEVAGWSKLADDEGLPLAQWIRRHLPTVVVLHKGVK